ncbi:hypothetical protein Patl1_17320 [Pistacia atlantica]|uniref:Uncharacterized protein n=1 Tax=Pistacia atlantica TaxID=434234 RepID=A0ACC1B731_9ROSI|nr:hypothetical protein Patl1_17320 [Pistacia atlantica]
MKLLRKLMRKASENEVVDTESELGKLERTILFRIVMGTRISKENREAEMMKNMVEESDILVVGISGADEAVKWAMVELINHPNLFSKVREEIESVVGRSSLVEESNVPNLPYLQALVKKSLRMIVRVLGSYGDVLLLSETMSL